MPTRDAERVVVAFERRKAPRVEPTEPLEATLVLFPSAPRARDVALRYAAARGPLALQPPWGRRGDYALIQPRGMIAVRRRSGPDAGRMFRRGITARHWLDVDAVLAMGMVV